MAQYDVHQNTSEITSEQFPYLPEVQFDLFDLATRVVAKPMVFAKTLNHPGKTLNPEFNIENLPVLFFPLDIASIDRSNLGETVTNLSSQSDTIVAALDLLFARA